MSTQEATQNTNNLELLGLKFKNNQTLEADSLNAMVTGTNRALDALRTFKDRLATIENTDYALSEDVNTAINSSVSAFLTGIENGYVSKESFSQDLETFKSELDQELFREVEEGSTDEPGKFTKYKEELSELYENLVKELDQFKQSITDVSTDQQKEFEDFKQIAQNSFENAYQQISTGLVAHENNSAEHAIGTVITSMRKYLDDSWLACNGAVLTPLEKYPDLADVLVHHEDYDASQSALLTTGKITEYSIKGFETITDDSGTTYYIITTSYEILYTTEFNLNSTSWSRITCQDLGMASITNIVYGGSADDKIWVIGGIAKADSYYTSSYLIYANSLEDFTTETGKTVFRFRYNYRSKDTIRLEKVVYLDGSIQPCWIVSMTGKRYTSSSSYYTDHDLYMFFGSLRGRTNATKSTTSSCDKQIRVNGNAGSTMGSLVANNITKTFSVSSMNANGVAWVKEYNEDGTKYASEYQGSDFTPKLTYLRNNVASNEPILLYGKSTSTASYYVHSTYDSNGIPDELENYAISGLSTNTIDFILNNELYWVQVSGNVIKFAKSTESFIIYDATNKTYVLNPSISWQTFTTTEPNYGGTVSTAACLPININNTTYFCFPKSVGTINYTEDLTGIYNITLPSLTHDTLYYFIKAVKSNTIDIDTSLGLFPTEEDLENDSENEEV